MYKSRIHKWGLDKKNKEHEARAIIHAHARRRGKPTQIRLRGRPINISSVKSYFKRKGIPIEEVLNSDAAPIPDLVCETPVTSHQALSRSKTWATGDDKIVLQLQGCMTRATPRHFASPDVLRTTELLCFDVHEYILISLTTMAQAEVTLWLFSELLESQAAEQLSADVFGYIEIMVDAYPTSSLAFLASSLVVILTRNDPKAISVSWLGKILWNMLGPNLAKSSRLSHVMGRILARICLLASFCEASDYLIILRCSLDTYHNSLGPFHTMTLAATITLSKMMRFLYGPAGLLEPLKELHSTLEYHGSIGQQSRLMLQEEMDSILRGRKGLELTSYFGTLVRCRVRKSRKSRGHKNYPQLLASLLLHSLVSTPE